MHAPPGHDCQFIDCPPGHCGGTNQHAPVDPAEGQLTADTRAQAATGLGQSLALEQVLPALHSSGVEAAEPSILRKQSFQ